MTLLRVALGTFFLLGLVASQDAAEGDNDDFVKALCVGKGPGEWFRLSTDDCRNVIQCTEAGLQALQCPHGLSFDLKSRRASGQISPSARRTSWLVEMVRVWTDNSSVTAKWTAAMSQTRTLVISTVIPNSAPTCQQGRVCRLPDCFCYHSGNEIPHEMNPGTVPQMITLTLRRCINNNNMDLYQLIFDGRLNPNQCSIKSTFFVSHKYTNYSAVQEMHRMGHEIAVHSVRGPMEREMAGARVIVDRFANISDNSVIGVRAPYLRACPTRSFAVWEMVMNEMDRREDPTIEAPLPGCAMVDSCFSSRPTTDQFYNFLNNNFERHYSTNRAPLGLFFHSAF
ncbi:hypothetical protein Pmani_033662 [Petrolisthes manimaculis]|uniref:Chitin-binding type-2 domain-containing protein n=1 Tax=Petrolisthes manimaculis TaxID=1843537 RepID=A0AAE1NRF9_9EUCA|nr:hypothetical protein Pmani_033662 [Petrolisthes manimaculis]